MLLGRSKLPPKKPPKKVEIVREPVVVRCPDCGKKAFEATQYFDEYVDYHFAHNCGADGVLHWVRGQEPWISHRKRKKQ